MAIDIQDAKRIVKRILLSNLIVDKSIYRERICQDDFFNFSKLNKPAEKKSS